MAAASNDMFRYDIQVALWPLEFDHDGDPIITREMSEPKKMQKSPANDPDYSKWTEPENSTRMNAVIPELARLQIESHHTDLTFLTSDGLHVWAHQSILAPVSPVIRAMREMTRCCGEPEDCLHPREDLVISLAGVRMEETLALLELLYTGKAGLDSREEIARLKALLRMLEVDLGSNMMLEETPRIHVNEFTTMIRVENRSEVKQGPRWIKKSKAKANDDDKSLIVVPTLNPAALSNKENEPEIKVGYSANNEFPFDCGSCERKFSSYVDLKEHVDRIHTVTELEEAEEVIPLSHLDDDEDAENERPKKRKRGRKRKNNNLNHQQQQQQPAPKKRKKPAPDEDEEDEIDVVNDDSALSDGKHCSHCGLSVVKMANLTHKLFHMTTHYKKQILADVDKHCNECAICGQHVGKHYMDRHLGVDHRCMFPLLSPEDRRCVAIWESNLESAKSVNKAKRSKKSTLKP